ncbi:Argininosuccinate lyase [Variovorax sp. SRS16]|uniref:Bug family tripartite tricarboxylate transporter substrate binding protein n=1 Tax=Variovorax sp. SRS16 TaxID=282217 RepID=UPI001316C048|nr:tripartite tricarboxylate transporter substrate binding protein [Variovorax sp. SRS16]VTU32094.1 Argininosuccinate lyase [Variovorax sp. SRS16]
MWKQLNRILVAAAAVLTLGLAHADYPERPVTIVVPYGPGGGTDLLARLLAAEMSTQLGQKFIVENVPGAGGVVGTRKVMESKADGYMLLLGSGSELELMQITDPQAKLERWTPLAPVGLIGTQPMILVGRSTMPARSTDALIAAMRADPGKYSYASAGVGTQLNILGELIKSSARVDMRHVPYKAAGQILTDVVGGHVDLAVMVLPSVLPQIRSGQVIAYGISDTQRSPAAPEIPTLDESTTLHDIDMKIWYGLFSPAGVPAPIADKINGAMRAALKQPAVKTKLLDMAVTAAPDPSAARLMAIKQDGLAKIKTVFEAIKPEK